MSGNIYGTVFKIATFGESHGTALGVVIDGCPSGIDIDIEKIQIALDRRRPGGAVNGIKSASGTTRNEADKVEILSGVFNGKSEGTPIALLIRNESQHSSDYENLKNTFRPGHADFTYDAKYSNRDYRGGGRSSGRETVARVAAGAVAKMILDKYGIKTLTYTLKAAGIKCEKINFDDIEKNSMRAADMDAANLMEAKIAEVRKNGDSVGGIIECVVQHVLAGLGEPVFDKLDAELAKAMLSIGAVKGIEFGRGFEVADLKGSENNDKMHAENGKAVFETNNAGGILGGISNGCDIVFRIAIKPVPSIFLSQNTVQKNENRDISSTTLEIKGRHDVCLCPRIVPVVEAMTNIVLADMVLRNNLTL